MATEALPRQDRHSWHDFTPHGLIGQSAGLYKVFELARIASRREIAVLILGESGTGKEVLAKAVHANSRRRNRALVSVNCAALPDGLLESELFGYRRGAFTGANSDKVGLVAAADGGTLFLDEVAELPLQLQAKLLRFLENGEYLRLGDSRPSHSDVRLISATNADLQDMAAQRRFRSDLLYRLWIFPIYIPPLRDRSEDIIHLAVHFLGEVDRRFDLTHSGFSSDAMEYLRSRLWPGNVRELLNAVEMAALVHPSGCLVASDFQDFLDAGNKQNAKLDEPGLLALGVSLPELNDRLIKTTLEQVGNNVSAAARRLGITRAALRYKLRKKPTVS